MPEETIEEKNARLETEKADLQARLNIVSDESSQEITRLSGLVAAKKDADAKGGQADIDVVNLKAANSKLQDAYAKLTEESTEEITRLSAQVASSRADAAKGILTVTIDGQKYRVIGKKFHIKGKDVTVADLVKDEELLDHLIEKESGILVKVTDVEPLKTA